MQRHQTVKHYAVYTGTEVLASPRVALLPGRVVWWVHTEHDLWPHRPGIWAYVEFHAPGQRPLGVSLSPETLTLIP